MRLILPISSPINPMAAVFVSPGAGITSDTNYDTGDTQKIALSDQASMNENVAVPGKSQNNEIIHSSITAINSFTLWVLVKSKLLWVWLAGTLISVAWFIAAYSSFSRRIRRSCVTPHHEDLAVFIQMFSNKGVSFACSSFVTTPMLIGAFNPIIVIPQFAYALNGKRGELEMILCHEMTHCRRKDILYKWIVAAVTSMHWFNPLMIFIRREISKACELSCDEAVIRDMSDDEKQRYGNTLLALAANKKFPIGILATTLCEEKNVLKERLVNIMGYKKKKKWAVILMLTLALLVTGCAASFGPAQKSDNAISEGGGGFNSPATAYSRTRSGELVNWNDNGCSYTLDENGDVILSYDNGKLTAKAPVVLQKSGSNYNLGPGVDEAGFLISKEKTAIAYGGLNGTEPINILISDDMGQTWSSSSMGPKWCKFGAILRANQNLSLVLLELKLL